MTGPLICFFKNIVILLVSDVYEQNQLNIISSLATVAKHSYPYIASDIYFKGEKQTNVYYRSEYCSTRRRD
jgi:hypothetical protein